MRLTNYIIRKLLSAAITLFMLTLLIYFTTTFLSPQRRAGLFASESAYDIPWGPSSGPEIIDKYGLNDPFYIQYARWVQGVLKGNLGWSYFFHTPVSQVISRSFPATLELVIYSAPIILIGGYKLGVFSAKRANSKAPREDPVDFALRSITILGYSIPSFCLGLMLLIIAFAAFGWVGLGRVGTAADEFIRSSEWAHYTGLYTIDSLLNGQLWIFVDAFTHLLLPVTTLTTQMIAIVARITRSSVIGELVKPHIITARAKGLTEGEIMDHAKKPSLPSILTVSGIIFGGMLSGLVVTEYLFQIKGVGYMIVATSVRRSVDYPLLVGLSVLFCVIFMLINLIVDMTYAYIDPRVKP